MSDSKELPQSTEQELIAIRTEKMHQLRELGIDPYGQKFPVTTTPGELKENFENKSILYLSILLSRTLIHT